MNNLAHYRNLRGLNQYELADMLGVSQPTIQRAEAEAPSAKLGTYKACAKVLDITLSQIFSDRTPFEEDVIRLLRKVHPSRMDQVLGVLDMAKALPPVDEQQPK